ncbi:MAG TPA: hypothetical protein VG347_09965 [Verrucomicrobiae bacterium]|nr:hypothetical protein [Verrucomicrobiae bacterium]
MKLALTILFSLLLLGAQAMVISVPAAGPAAQNCGCGGKMACCKTAPVSHSAPVDATTATASQQILSPVPASVVLVLLAAATPSISPTVPAFLSVTGTPLFARLCVRLI